MPPTCHLTKPLSVSEGSPSNTLPTHSCHSTGADSQGKGLQPPLFLGCRYVSIKDKPQTTAHSWPGDTDIENDHVSSPREKLQVPQQPRRFAGGCGDIYGEGPEVT